MRTWPAPGSGISRSTIWNGPLALTTWAARIFGIDPPRSLVAFDVRREGSPSETPVRGIFPLPVRGIGLPPRATPLAQSPIDTAKGAGVHSPARKNSGGVMKAVTVSSFVLAGLVALSPLAGADDKPKKEAPKIKIPEPGVPQIMTMEGRYVRAAYNNEGYVI